MDGDGEGARLAGEGAEDEVKLFAGGRRGQGKVAAAVADGQGEYAAGGDLVGPGERGEQEE
jgi:hypothetical protein